MTKSCHTSRNKELLKLCLYDHLFSIRQYQHLSPLCAQFQRHVFRLRNLNATQVNSVKMSLQKIIGLSL